MTKKRTRTQREYEERLLRVLLHVQANLDAEIELEELAAIACFSPFHFHRIFCSMVGEPVLAHVRRLRLERAAVRLKHGNDRVIQLALEAGYETPESFSRAFRRRFGVSPREYRRLHQPVAAGERRRPPEEADVHFEPLRAEKEMNARTETLKTMHVAFVRHTGPYEQVGAAWGQLCGWAGGRGLLGADTRMLGLSYDDPEVTPADSLRYDACLVVSAEVRADGAVGVREIPAWRYAVATHVGPYERLGETYSQLLGQWMPAKDLQPSADRPCLEFYRNDPQSTPPAELETEIFVPIEDGAPR